MIAEIPSAAAPADPGRSLAAAAHPAGQHRPSEDTSRIPRARARTGADPAVIDLVARAGAGDKQAWNMLVERYAPLIWSICRRYRLSDADADDVGQNVWLHLLDHLDGLRDPAALPGWLATTTRHECGRVLREAGRPSTSGHVLDAGMLPDQQAATVDQELLETARRSRSFRHPASSLSPC